MIAIRLEQHFGQDTDPAVLKELIKESRRFFESYGNIIPVCDTEPSLCNEKSFSFGSFKSLLSACGYEKDKQGFFNTLFQQIKAGPKTGICINKVRIPQLYLYHLLDIIIPSNDLISVRTVGDLETKAFMKVDEQQAHRLQQVIDTYPVRLSSHVIRQALVSEKVAAQYFPFTDEIDANGHEITFEGHLRKGLFWT